jgi:hypothetical protein
MRQAMMRKYEPYIESPNSSILKEGETGEEQSQEHAHHFPLKICENYVSNFGDKNNCCCFTTMHRFTLPF